MDLQSWTNLLCQNGVKHRFRKGLGLDLGGHHGLEVKSVHDAQAAWVRIPSTLLTAIFFSNHLKPNSNTRNGENQEKS